MKTSDAAKQAIGTFEGLKLKAYRCPSGVLTIGYGHTKGVYEGMQITKEQAAFLIIFIKMNCRNVLKNN